CRKGRANTRGLARLRLEVHDCDTRAHGPGHRDRGVDNCSDGDRNGDRTKQGARLKGSRSNETGHRRSPEEREALAGRFARASTNAPLRSGADVDASIGDSACVRRASAITAEAAAAIARENAAALVAASAAR